MNAPEPKSLRDEFAMAALTGLLLKADPYSTTRDRLANMAYEFADSMLEARKYRDP